MSDLFFIHTLPSLVLLVALLYMLVMLPTTNQAQRVLIGFGLFSVGMFLCHSALMGTPPQLVVWIHCLSLLFLSAMIASFAYYSFIVARQGVNENHWYLIWPVLSTIFCVTNCLCLLTRSSLELQDFYNYVCKGIPSQISAAEHPFYHAFASWGYYSLIGGASLLFIAETIWGQFEAKRFRALLATYYADKESSSRWGKLSLPLLVLAIVISITLSGATYRQDSLLWHSLAIASELVFTITLVYYICNLRFTIRDLEKELERNQPDIHAAEERRAGRNLTPQEEEEEEAERQLRQGIHQHLYIDPTLNLPILASRLGITPSHLRSAIKRIGYASFADMINSLRAEYAYNLSLSHPELSDKELAQQAGFTNIETYQRYKV